MRTPTLPPMPPAPGVSAAIDSAVRVEAFPPVVPPVVHVASVPSQTDPPVELPSPPHPAARPAIAAAHALESRLRETAKQHHIKLTGTLLTCA